MRLQPQLHRRTQHRVVLLPCESPLDFLLRTSSLRGRSAALSRKAWNPRASEVYSLSVSRAITRYVFGLSRDSVNFYGNLLRVHRYALAFWHTPDISGSLAISREKLAISAFPHQLFDVGTHRDSDRWHPPHDSESRHGHENDCRVRQLLR